MVAPTIPPVLVLNDILMNFPNRDELSFFNVRAFPKLSRRGLDDRTRSSNDAIAPFASPSSFLLLLVLSVVPLTLVTRARYCIIFFVASVFPAPLSPLIMTL